MPSDASVVSNRRILSRDADEVSAFFSESFSQCLVRPLRRGADLVYDARYLIGDNFMAGAGVVGEGLDVAPQAEMDMVMVHIGQRGSFRVETPGGPIGGTDDAIIVSATRTSKRVVYGAGHSEIFIGVGADDVRRSMGAQLDFEVHAAFDFQLALAPDSPLGSAVCAFGSLLHAGLVGDTLLQSSPIGLRRYKDTFIDLALGAIGMEAVRSLAGPPKNASFHQVRKAEDFMRASGQNAIGISDVAYHIGVSVRALQYAFRQHRGTTPIAALQQIRLEGLRDALRRGSAEPIAVVAARWGFTHLGRMARQYRSAFGQKPSETALDGKTRRRAQAAGQMSNS